ncbi:MAG: sugar phosphate isomerase/epimerase [Ruminococcaceae bacterium]|nr:sugar phosphate isomerase/epimerase [Oscillospiraceae bacterium]
MNQIGVLITMHRGTDVLAEMQKVSDMGCHCCQLVIWDTTLYTEENARAILAASEKTGVEISTLWAGWVGPTIWNFTDGPSTLGIVPEQYRERRTEQLLKGADFAKRLGVSRMATHAGFLPENCIDPQYPAIIETLKRIVDRCKENGVNFLFETGQETPVTLLRVIEDLGGENVGVNMDTANLILYGKANSADAITVFGKYVMDTHIKDGFYPTCGKELGEEVAVGQGMANIPEVIKRLQAVGYTGNYIIEREISGDEQTRDIKATIEYLKEILENV